MPVKVSLERMGEQDGMGGVFPVLAALWVGVAAWAVVAFFLGLWS